MSQTGIIFNFEDLHWVQLENLPILISNLTVFHSLLKKQTLILLGLF